MKTIRDVPLTLNCEVPLNIEVRGEIYFDKDDFETLNLRQAKSGEKIFVNSRNAAAGTLRQLTQRTGGSVSTVDKYLLPRFRLSKV